MRILPLLLIGVLLAGCKKKNTPKPPEKANLVFPQKNSECTTGQELNATSSQVEFKWQTANNTETYVLRVTNITTGTAQTISTSDTSAKLPLQKGAPYSWLVISKNSGVIKTVSSETWRFYNSGFQTTYAPFPAEIIEPKSGASAFKDINNDVALQWSGADIDNDIVGFELYFSTETPPTLIGSPGAGATTKKVAVVANTIYYWKVITKDSEGNTSDSGIFDFKAL